MTAPATQLTIRDDEGPFDLETFAAVIEGDDLSQAQIDAQASLFLERMATIGADLRRYEEARHAEMQALTMRIQNRYDLITEPLERERFQLERAVHMLAQRADFGKAKSRKVGFGRYGRRLKPERLSIVDEPAALAYARENIEGAVRWVVKLPHSVWTMIVETFPELADNTDIPAKPELMAGILAKELVGRADLPPGVVREPAVDVPFAETE